MSSHSLSYGDTRIRFTLRFRADRPRGRVAIHVEPDGSVLVDAPRGTELACVKGAVRKRAAWITRHLEAARARREHVTPREYVSGETWPYLGRRYRLRVIVSRGSLARVAMRGAFIEVTVPRAGASTVRAALQAWYRERAREVLAQRLAAVTERFRWLSAPPPMAVRAMTRQWGSCSPAGRISLNTALIKAPRECIDYVLAHEIAHLRHRNHGAAFYRELGRVAPNWQEVKQRLDNLAEQLLSGATAPPPPSSPDAPDAA